MFEVSAAPAGIVALDKSALPWITNIVPGFGVLVFSALRCAGESDAKTMSAKQTFVSTYAALMQPARALLSQLHVRGGPFIVYLLTLLVTIDGTSNLMSLVSMVLCFIAMALHMHRGIACAVDAPTPSHALLVVRPCVRAVPIECVHLRFTVLLQLYRIMNAVQIIFLLIQYGFEFVVIADAVSAVWPAAGFLSLNDVGVLQ